MNRTSFEEMAAISAAYIEAREALARIKNYRGDKRRRTYKRMAEASPVWRARMNNFAALLGLPTAGEVFYNDPAPDYCQPAQPAQTEQQTKKHMTKKTNKALAGLKYGQTLNETEAAAVAAEWQKAMKKAVRVTLADSISGGNCRPGTLSFVNRVAEVLGYEPESLSGREVIEYGRRFGVELYARRAVKAAARREAGE